MTISIVTLSAAAGWRAASRGSGASPSTLSTRIFIGHGVSRPAPRTAAWPAPTPTAETGVRTQWKTPSGSGQSPGSSYRIANAKLQMLTDDESSELADFLDPKTAARIFHEQRQILFRDRSVMCRDVGVEEHHFEGRVELQKRLKEVVLFQALPPRIHSSGYRKARTRRESER